MNETRIATYEDFPPDGRGFGCVDCETLFQLGDEYVSCLVGMVGDTPLYEVKCRPCSEKT